MTNENLIKAAQELGLLHIIHVPEKRVQSMEGDHVACPHCGEVSHIGGLVGPTTDDCPRCGGVVLEAV